MIVDDSLIVRQQVNAALSQSSVELIEAMDGDDALKKLQASPDVDLVICDVNMPKLNGLEMLERLRKTPNIAHIAVLMLTTEGQPEYIAKAKSLGAKGWMVKPFKAELLVAAVKKLTTQK